LEGVAQVIKKLKLLQTGTGKEYSEKGWVLLFGGAPRGLKKKGNSRKWNLQNRKGERSYSLMEATVTGAGGRSGGKVLPLINWGGLEEAIFIGGDGKAPETPLEPRH